MSNNHNNESRVLVRPKSVDHSVIQPLDFTAFKATLGQMTASPSFIKQRDESELSWGREQEAQRRADPFRNPIAASVVNMKTARLGRRCIVEHMYYQDVGHIVAPGGVGKTTMLLHHAMEIVTGGNIFGCEVHTPGPVVYISAEDDADSLLSRLWQMCKHLEHDEQGKHDLDLIARDLHVIDAAGRGDTKLTTVARDRRGREDGTAFTQRFVVLLDTLKRINPVMVFIDPLVSFNGLGEGKVNDSEQVMIEAARVIVRQVHCGVVFVHHSGKALVRKGEEEQYSGRGGSALADGSRMVFTLQKVAPDEWLKATGEDLGDRESGLLFSRPKMTWARPNLPPLYVRRDGFQFFKCDHIAGVEGAETRLENDALKVEKFLRDQWPITFSQNDLISRDLLPQKRTREAVAYLKQHGRVSDEKQTASGRGGARSFLRPVDSA